jgi:hypothetical protein
MSKNVDPKSAKMYYISEGKRCFSIILYIVCCPYYKSPKMFLVVGFGFTAEVPALEAVERLPPVVLLDFGVDDDAGDDDDRFSEEESTVPNSLAVPGDFERLAMGSLTLLFAAVAVILLSSFGEFCPNPLDPPVPNLRVLERLESPVSSSL